MVTLYDFIGVKPDASQEQVTRAIEDTRRRFLMTGEMNKSHDKLREVESTLGDPAERSAYNKKLGLPVPNSVAQAQLSPPKRKVAVPLSPKRVKTSVAVLVVALLILGTYWTIKFAPRFRSFPVGCYLVHKSTGKAGGILTAKRAGYTFQDGSRGEAFEVLLLAKRERVWLSDADLRRLFNPGEAAPKEEWVEEPPSSR